MVKFTSPPHDPTPHPLHPPDLPHPPIYPPTPPHPRIHTPKTPPTGSPEAAALNGQYALFGFVLEGVEQLSTLEVGDFVQSVRLVGGGEFMQRPKPNPNYSVRRTARGG